jgi:hypothetical protein
MSCNGWSNSETWNVNLWFGDMFAEMAEEYSDIETLAEVFESTVYDIVEQDCSLESSFAADCILGVLRRVNWTELAEHHAVKQEEELEELVD